MRFVEAKCSILCCVFETRFVKNVKIAIFAGSAAHLDKPICICVRTENRPFHESLINNASERAFFLDFFLVLYDEKS